MANPVRIVSPQRRERRRYRRYIVRGLVTIQGNSTETTGELRNLGWGGILIRSNVIHPEASNLSLWCQLEGYPETLYVLGRVVGTQPNLMAIQFLKPPAGMDALLSWLDRENFLWTDGS